VEPRAAPTLGDVLLFASRALLRARAESLFLCYQLLVAVCAGASPCRTGPLPCSVRPQVT
jgi:hypothetical protein